MKKVYLWSEPENVRNYMAALEAVDVQPVVSKDLSLAEGCHGLLLPGGADVDPGRYGQENCGSLGIDLERDAAELAVFHQFFDRGLPILGICRGHQVLNVALGGSLIQHIDGHSQVEGKDHVHMVEATHPFLSTMYGERFPTNSSHHQVLDRLGSGLVATCVSADGYNEGVIHENGRVLGFQFHPERMTLAHRREDTVDGIQIFKAFAAML